MKEGRFGQIRKIHEQIVEGLGEEDKKDKGIVRKEVSDKDKELGSKYSPEQKNEIMDRAMNRYLSEYKIGEKGSNGCIEAIHSQMANYGEIMKVLRKKGISSSREEVFEKEALVKKQLEEEGSESVFRKLKNMLEAAEAEGDEVLAAIVGLKRVHEEKTGNIARSAAEISNSSLIIPRRSRMTVDPNRVVSDRKINKKRDAEEFGDGFHLAYYGFLQKVFEESLEQKSEGVVEKPFLHISLHGKGNVKTDGDIVIANAMKGGKLPCDPEIARWIQSEMKERFESLGLKKDSNEPYSINVVEEGQKYSGNQIQVDRRFGLKGHKPLGENYQYIQIELSIGSRYKYERDIGEIFAEIIKDFKDKFSDKNDLEEYIQQNKTEKDEKRRRGVVVKTPKYIDDLAEDKILLNKSHRSALGVNVGDKVIVNNVVLEVGPSTKEDLTHRMPIISNKSGISEDITIENVAQ